MSAHTVIKFVTGIIVVPLSIIVNQIWPWWTKTSLPVQIIAGFFILPLAGLVYVLVYFWENY